jgi:hypothetical protein
MGFFGGGGAAPANMTGSSATQAGVAGLVPAPAAGDQEKALRGDATFAHPVFFPQYKLSATSRFFSFPSAGSTGDSGIAFNSALNLVPIWVPETGTYTKIAVHNTTTNATGTCRIGIYNADTELEPSTLVLDAGTVALDTAAVKEITISQSLNRGLYYGAAVANQNVNWRCQNTTAWHFVLNGAGEGTSTLRMGSHNGHYRWLGTGSTAHSALPTNVKTTGISFEFNQQSQLVALKK